MDDCPAMTMIDSTAAPGRQPAVGSPLERVVRPRPVEALLRTMDRAGWALDWVDLDLTGSAPRLEIRATRHDGLWVRAYVDQLGRATLERFQRERTLGVPQNKKAGARMPMAPLVDDHFMGRQRYEGGRSMMRGLCAYLADNALHPVALADMRAAWAALMQAPARIAGPNTEAERQP
jgi:hypothetical protein